MTRTPTIEDARRALEEHFGHARFRPAQVPALEAVLAGRDVLAILPTGGGKSVLFQVPALVLPGPVVVVSPLIALMEDQVAGAARRDIPALRLGGLRGSARAAALARVRAAGRGLIYVAPEALVGDTLDALAAARPSLFAVDEAHCLSSWGPSFRPDYRDVGIVRRALGDPPALAVTASATPAVVTDIVDTVGLRSHVTVRASTFRPNLTLGFQRVSSAREVASAAVDAAASSPGAGIVYCRTRDQAESTAARLRRAGVAAEAYHAGMSAEERAAVAEAFAARRLQVMAATVAFGMGVDRADIRWVVHRGLPATVDGYYQEVGRAGRDGLPSRCLALWSVDDLPSARRLRTGLPDRVARQAEAAFEAVVRLASGGCRHQAIARWFGERIGPCRTSCDVCAKGHAGA
jgi:ATP-dependent DNA helicase RecQ